MKAKSTPQTRKTLNIDELMDSFTDYVRYILIDDWGVQKTKRSPNAPKTKRKKYSKLHKKLRAQKRKIRMALKRANHEKKDKKYIAKRHYIRRHIIRALSRRPKHDEKSEKT